MTILAPKKKAKAKIKFSNKYIADFLYPPIDYLFFIMATNSD